MDPYLGQDFNVFGYVVSRDESPVVTIDVAIDFLDHSVDKIVRIRLSQGLMKVHYVAHHFGEENDRTSHPFLEFEVEVVAGSIIMLAD